MSIGTDPVVSIVVVSYNTREMTLACLASVHEQTTVHFELIVVDNASGDGSAEAIAERFPEVELIEGAKVAAVHRLCRRPIASDEVGSQQAIR